MSDTSDILDNSDISVSQYIRHSRHPDILDISDTPVS